MRKQDMNRDWIATAATLSAALPYLQRYNDAVVVIKLGGHAMSSDEAMDNFARDVVLMQHVGVNPVIVHGGGPMINEMLDKLDIDQPNWSVLSTMKEAIKFANNVGFPVLVRPSFVLSGAAMRVCTDETQLVNFLTQAADVAGDKPVVVTKFVLNAKEIEVRAGRKNNCNVAASNSNSFKYRHL